MFEVRQSDPFKKWFAGLNDLRARSRIQLRLDRLEMGHFGDAKAVGLKVTELRIDYGPGYRIYLTRRGQTLVVLLCGGDKSSQQRDIAKALELAEEA